MQNEEPLEFGEIALTGWNAHTDKMAEVGFLTIAGRLPSLVGQALRMAWAASPRDTRPEAPISAAGSQARWGAASCWRTRGVGARTR
ncbi:hypothetical protein AB0J43_44255, partial [Nonomuraea fuscirosea]